MPDPKHSAPDLALSVPDRSEAAIPDWARAAVAGREVDLREPETLLGMIAYSGECHVREMRRADPDGSFAALDAGLRGHLVVLVRDFALQIRDIDLAVETVYRLGLLILEENIGLIYANAQAVREEENPPQVH